MEHLKIANMKISVTKQMNKMKSSSIISSASSRPFSLDQKLVPLVQKADGKLST